jgi:serine/threonine protein kinase
MHACGITHTDMKTENILVYHRFDQEDILHERDDVRLPLTVRIVDLGSATFESEWHQPIIGTNEYRAPEGILQLGWSFEVDVWAVGCIMFELLTGKKLFGETMADNVHLILMERCLEKALPQSMLQKAWSMGGAREKQVLVAEGPAGKNQVIGISSICQDMLQAKTVKDSTKLADEVSDEVLNELLMEFFEYEPDRRKKAGPLRKHRFFDRCRFDLSRLDTTDSLSPLTVNLDEQAAHSPPPWNEPKINANSAEKGNDLPRSTSNPPDRNMLTPPSGRIRPVKTPPISPLLGAAKTAESAEVFY